MTSAESGCFHYRLPRFATPFPVQVLAAGDAVQGHCLNLSETGLLAHLAHPVVAEGTVTVRLLLPPYTLDLLVELASLDGCRAGFRFLFASDQQRQFVRAVVQGVRPLR